MRRILVGTVLLGGLGALAGALAGALVIAALEVTALFTGSPPTPRPEFPVSMLFAIVSGIGFAVGSVAAPMLTSTLMRRVPMWRAAAETAGAAAIAFILAIMNSRSLALAGAIAVTASVLAAMRLRYVFRSREQQSAPANGEL